MKQDTNVMHLQQQIAEAYTELQKHGFNERSVSQVNNLLVKLNNAKKQAKKGMKDYVGKMCKMRFDN